MILPEAQSNQKFRMRRMETVLEMDGVDGYATI